MAHEITIDANGKAEMAFLGNRAAIWHGLGQELTDGASIEDWIVEAGLAWEIFQSAVQYSSMDGSHVFDDKRVLFRSDTKAPLSIVGKDYKVVQPGDVLEFFRDLTTLHGMKLSTAGSLFGGKRFWALAETGSNVEAFKGDITNGYVLLVTSADGTMATQARLTSTRVVCNNTLTAAINGHSKQVVKKSHRSDWDPASVKLDMGLIDESWDTFSKSLKKLAEVDVTDKFAQDYFQKKFYTPGVLAEDQNMARIKEVAELMDLYRNGTGANFSYGSAYGIVQAATEKYTHGSGKRDQSHQFWNSYFGKGDTLKSDVFEDMLALCA